MITNAKKETVEGSIPAHAVHQLIARMTAPPELKQLLTNKLQNHNHGQMLKVGEIERTFKEIKLNRAGSNEAFHIDQLHKSITSHIKTNGTLSGFSTANHPGLYHL